MVDEAAPPISVLVVDDAPETLTMLTDALTLEGMEVRVAVSGKQALEAARHATPDLVLLDAIMPRMDGFETCQALKADPAFADLPVIFMTGFNDTDHVVRAMQSGGVDFIAKPVPLDELFARLQVHLANARRARSARKALDSTGRRIVSCGVGGEILWATPQAARLLDAAGLAREDGKRLPQSIVEWLAETEPAPSALPPAIRVHKKGRCVEFRLIEQGSDGEALLRLLDCNLGSDEDRLMREFDLTLREAEVLLWITHGKSNKEIGEILSMSPRTVNKHLEQVFSKIGVENRTAAATMAVRILWHED